MVPRQHIKVPHQLPLGLCLLLLLLSVSLPTVAWGIEEDEKPAAAAMGESAQSAIGAAKGEAELPTVAPPPRFARYKHALPDLLLKEKQAGRYIVPIPIFGYDPDTGINFGAGVSFFQNGEKESPFFSITPYRQLLSAQFIATTEKVFQFNAYYDQPYFMDTPWRVRGELEIYRNPIDNYFGIGSAGTALTFPGSPTVFGSYRDYKDAQENVVNGTTYSHYDEFKYSKVAVRGAAEYDLLGGLIRPLIGFQVAHVWIGDYSGGVSNNVVQQPTHLRDDCNSGRAIGCKGGNDIYLKFGLTFDTRDFEPDPTKGIVATAMSEFSPKFLGSAFNYGRITSALMGYGDILKFKTQQLIITGRFTYSWQFGDVPFYSMNIFAMEDQDDPALGGIENLRGYALNRFIGPVGMVANVELRHTFAQFNVFKQNIKLMAVPFLDYGRVFDSNSDIAFKDWNMGGGVGLHLAWNLSTIVSFDYAWSAEDQAFYMDLGHQF
jgi:hypothetical protein